VFGRYTRHGHVAVTLSGQVEGEPRKFVYEVTFPEVSAENDFIPRLWATRKVGFLLDEIRLHGEDSELRDEVVRLSREYGIMTPYTSYLVLEKDSDYVAHGIDRGEKQAELGKALAQPGSWFGGASRTPAPAPPGEPSAAAAGRPEDAVSATTVIPLFSHDADAEAEELARESAGEAKARAQVVRSTSEDRRMYFARDEGRDAVDLSEAIASYKRADASQPAGPPAVRHVGKRIFYLIGDTWTDRRYRTDMETIRLQYASDEYFAFLRKHPELKGCFALGVKVTVCLDDDTAVTVL
jgi:Ca-activated chloride channel family protein